MPTSPQSSFVNYYSCRTCGHFHQRAGTLLQRGRCPKCHSDTPAALCDKMIDGLGIVIVHQGDFDALRDTQLET